MHLIVSRRTEQKGIDEEEPGFDRVCVMRQGKRLNEYWVVVVGKGEW